MRITTTNIKLQTTYLRVDQSDQSLWDEFRSKYVTTDSCWQWIGSRSLSSPKGGRTRYYGYMYVDGKPQYAHRVSYSLHNGPIDHGLCVMHICDNPLCVNPNHLRLGTHKENMEDAVKKGRMKCLEQHGRAKLTNSQVQDIRRMKGLITYTDIAKMYKVSVEAISQIMLGKTWKKLPWPEEPREEIIGENPEIIIIEADNG